MFCLTCGSFLAGTAFFMLCGPIFVYTYGGLIRTRFIRTYVYNLEVRGRLVFKALFKK